MRFGSTDLRRVLIGSFNHHWEADLYYNGSRRIEGLPIDDVNFSEDAGAEIQQSGSCTVVWSDEFATSITPTEITDPLAPFGAQLFVYSTITAGPFRERVEYGRYQIVDVPEARDEHMQFRGALITRGSTVQLELKELLHGVSLETFDVPKAPDSLTSVWAEIALITGLPLSRTVSDSTIPRSIMYPEKKLEAVYELLDVVLDAAPHMTADGALAARPNVWPAPVDTLTMAGSIVEVGNSMSADEIYNRVVVRATGGDQKSVLAVAEITTGPLRVRNPDGTVSPFRARTLYLSSELITTAAAAQAWADSTLPQVSTLRSQMLPVVETFNPLRERGDVVLIERPTKTLLGRVAKITRSRRETQDLIIEIAGEA